MMLIVAVVFLAQCVPTPVPEDFDRQIHGYDLGFCYTPKLMDRGAWTKQREEMFERIWIRTIIKKREPRPVPKPNRVIDRIRYYWLVRFAG